MNVDEQVLCGLIKKSMFGTPLSSDVEINWERVLNIAQDQAILGIVFKLVPSERGQIWKSSFSALIAHNIQNLHAQSELVSLFQGDDIPLVILKGTAAAIYYPIPLFRSFGDIDFIVPQNLFSSATSLMIENGYQLTKETELEGNRHVRFKKDGIIYELHHHFSYDDLDIEDYIYEGLRRVEYANINDISFPMFPRLANGLVLLAHMRSHLQSGMGLRQIIDWMMYVNKELDDEFWKGTFKREAEKTKLDVLAVTTTRLCQKYLGLSESIHWCKDADELLCDSLMEQLFASGNLGTKLGKGKQVEAVLTSFGKFGLFKYLQMAGEKNWNAYKKRKWLKPFCWIYQIFRYCKQGIRADRRGLIISDVNRSKDRYKLLKQLNLI